MILSAIGALLGSSAFGTLMGSLFAWLNHRVDLDAKKLDQTHEQARWAHELAVKDKELEYAKVEAAARKDVAFTEGEASVEAARMSALAAAQTADQVTADQIKEAGGMGWMLVLALAATKLIRPLATAVLLGAALYLNWLLIDKLATDWPSMDKAQRYEAGMQAAQWVMCQASAALGYWFMSRGSARQR